MVTWLPTQRARGNCDAAMPPSSFWSFPPFRLLSLLHSPSLFSLSFLLSLLNALLSYFLLRIPFYSLHFSSFFPTSYSLAPYFLLIPLSILFFLSGFLFAFPFVPLALQLFSLLSLFPVSFPQPFSISLLPLILPFSSFILLSLSALFPHFLPIHTPTYIILPTPIPSHPFTSLSHFPSVPNSPFALFLFPPSPSPFPPLPLLLCTPMLPLA